MPSLCGSFLRDKRSLVAFTWSLTVFCTFVTFILSVILMIHVHTSYSRMERAYQEEYEYNQNQWNNYQNDEGEEEAEEQHNSGDREYLEYISGLSSMQSNSLIFVAVYTMALSIALSLYGSTTIVGFTSLRGVYIAPCFSEPSNLKLGMFGGAIILFANLLLVCAVIFGEVQVQDFRNYRREGDDPNNNNNNNNEKELPYEIEQLATILAVTCMFLAALYSIFAVLLFLYFGNGDEQPRKQQDADPRRENFITINNS